jgi:hypothetical protein
MKVHQRLIRSSDSNFNCMLCEESIWRCKCKRFCSSINISQYKEYKKSYDAFLIFISLFMTFYLYLRQYSLFIMFVPTIICYIIIKLKFLNICDSHLIFFLLEICRFVIVHHRLILFFLLLSFVLPYLDWSLVYFLNLCIGIYLLAKYLNSRQQNCFNEAELLIQK